MDNIPFGVSRLDSIIGGGSPPGNVILLSGEGGAGAREFLYTSATINALGHSDEDLFDLHYGTLDEHASLPPEIHYLSFTGDETHLRREMEYTMDRELVETAIPHIEFRDMSPEYFQLSSVPREWYLGETQTLSDLGNASGRENLMTALGTYLSRNAPGNLVLVDSVSDLAGEVSDQMTWDDIAMLMKGLARASHNWGGLILLLANRDTLRPTEYGRIADATDGTLEFQWETGGSKRARTMVVKQFRGVLSRLESENIVQFETEINESGLDISDVRKIR